MDQLIRAAPRDRYLAVWAGACLGGTALTGVAMFLLLAAALSPREAVFDHPVATVLTATAVIAFFTSLITLSRLGKAASDLRRRNLWYRSLICNLVVVGIVIAAFATIKGLAGIKVGLALCVMELIAIALHIVALSLPSVRHDS